MNYKIFSIFAAEISEKGIWQDWREQVSEVSLA